MLPKLDLMVAGALILLMLVPICSAHTGNEYSVMLNGDSGIDGTCDGIVPQTTPSDQLFENDIADEF